MSTAIAKRDDYDGMKTMLAKRADDFRAALPAHITPEKFQRTTMTAVQSNPDLLTADRGSFITACMKAAQDGLLPDGREAALVTFRTSKKDAQGKWSQHLLVQYMPMVYGLRKKILQSGEIADIQTAVVYRQEIEAGLFIYEEGTERTLRHKPLLDPAFDPTDDDIAAVYSIATFKDGGKSFEVMPRRDINKIRQASQTGALGKTTRDGRPIPPKGPWVEWFSEMARKSVMRRHSKTLPMSGDIIDIEAMEDAIAARSTTQLLASAEPDEPLSLPPGRDEFPDDADDTLEHNAETGELTDTEPRAESSPVSPDDADPGPVPSSSDDGSAPSSPDASEAGMRCEQALKAVTTLEQVQALRTDWRFRADMNWLHKNDAGLFEILAGMIKQIEGGFGGESGE